MKIITFFNCRGKIGKTTMIYHLAHKFAEKGVKVLAVDLDPQAGLTEMFAAEKLELNEQTNNFSELSYYIEFYKDYVEKYDYLVNTKFSIQLYENLHLISGGSSLALLEMYYFDAWKAENLKSVRSISDMISIECKRNSIDVVIIDIAANFGSLNKSVFFSSDYLIVPETNTNQGTFQLITSAWRRWKVEWEQFFLTTNLERISEKFIQPAGYLILNSGVKKDLDPIEITSWEHKIAAEYYSSFTAFLNPDGYTFIPPQIEVYTDHNCLTLLNYYRSLYPMALEAGKPMFHLTPADGAIGNHLNAVRQCSLEYDILAERINEACELDLKL